MECIRSRQSSVVRIQPVHGAGVALSEHDVFCLVRRKHQGPLQSIVQLHFADVLLGVQAASGSPSSSSCIFSSLPLSIREEATNLCTVACLSQRAKTKLLLALKLPAVHVSVSILSISHFHALALVKVTPKLDVTHHAIHRLLVLQGLCQLLIS